MKQNRTPKKITDVNRKTELKNSSAVYSTGRRYAAQNARVKRACVSNTHAHKAKLISIYELAHCRPIVVISLLVLIAFYCINVYGNGYSAEHRLANPALCLFQFTGKHVEIT